MSLLAMRDDSAFAIFQILNAVTPFITPDPRRAERFEDRRPHAAELGSELSE